MGDRTDWAQVLEGLVAGDRLAVLALNRLVTNVLTHLRAYDLREEWDDLRQEVLLSVLAGARARRLREPAAFVAYVRAVTRNKVVDRLKRGIRHHEGDTLPWDDVADRVTAEDPAGARPDAAEVWAAVEDLPEAQRVAIEGVYRLGKRYQEVADETGVPLGTLKRRLSEGLRALRARLGGGGEPIGAPGPTSSREDRRGTRS